MARFRAEILAGALVLALAAAAHADPRAMSDTARAELERGQQLFAEKDYAGAIASYDAGFALDPHPDFLYAKGQAQRLSGDCAGAIQSYSGFLASSPPDAEARVTRFNIARCERELAAVKRGPETVEVRERPWYHDVLGGVLAGGALVAAGVGTGYLLAGDGHVDNANNADDLGEYYDERDLARSDRKIGAIALVAGGALAVGAVLRYALHDRDKIQVTATLAPHGGALVLGGAF